MSVKNEEDYLRELVKFESVSSYRDRDGSKKCAQHCADYFEKCGLHTLITEHNGYPSVVATTQNTKTPKVLLYCHMDVVPGKPELFKLRKSGGKLYGRGVMDMKFACASYMKLLDRLGKNVFSYDFGIMLVFDEEVGGHNGVESLLKNGFSSDVCLLPDAGGNWNMECDSKGSWFIKISKDGKSAHGSRAFEGINSAELLLPAIDEIIALRNNYEYADLSLNLTKYFSGKAMNQIPNRAEAVFDIRFRNKAIYENIESAVGAVCYEHGTTLETIEYGDCMHVDKKNPYIQTYIPIAEEVLGKKITFSTSSGSTDGRYFCAKGIPCIVIQPNGGGGHSDDEWVDAEDIKKLTEITLQFIRKCAKISQ